MKSVWDRKSTDDPKYKIHWDANSVYAWLPIVGRYEWYKVTYWHLLERSFLGSCSSQWSWGIWRMPNLCLGEYGNKVYPDGPADTMEEAGEELVRAAIAACQQRHETGLPVSAGNFKLMIVELADCYHEGWQIDKRSLAGLNSLTSLRKELQQPGYTAQYPVDNRLLVLFEDEYEKYLWEHLAQFHQYTPINIGVSVGDLYYLTEQHQISEAINRLWFGMRAITPGTIVYDLERLHWLETRHELYGFYPADPGSIREAVGTGEMDFGYGHMRSPERDY